MGVDKKKKRRGKKAKIYKFCFYSIKKLNTCGNSHICLSCKPEKEITFCNIRFPSIYSICPYLYIFHLSFFLSFFCCASSVLILYFFRFHFIYKRKYILNTKQQNTHSPVHIILLSFALVGNVYMYIYCCIQKQQQQQP